MFLSNLVFNKVNQWIIKWTRILLISSNKSVFFFPKKRFISFENIKFINCLSSCKIFQTVLLLTLAVCTINLVLVFGLSSHSLRISGFWTCLQQSTFSLLTWNKLLSQSWRHKHAKSCQQAFYIGENFHGTILMPFFHYSSQSCR